MFKHIIQTDSHLETRTRTHESGLGAVIDFHDLGVEQSNKVASLLNFFKIVVVRNELSFKGKLDASSNSAEEAGENTAADVVSVPNAVLQLEVAHVLVILVDSGEDLPETAVSSSDNDVGKDGKEARAELDEDDWSHLDGVEGLDLAGEHVVGAGASDDAAAALDGVVNNLINRS